MGRQQHLGAAGGPLLKLACFVVVVAGMRASAEVLVPVLMALFVTIVCAQLITWLRRKGAPTWAALLIMLAVVAVLGALLVDVVSSSAQQFSQQLPVYQERLHVLAEKFGAWAQGFGFNLPKGGLLKQIDASWVTKLLAQLVGGLTQLATNAVFVLLTVVFMLLESVGIRQKLARAMGHTGRDLAWLDDVVERIQHYMALKSLMSLITGAAVGLWLYVVGVDYPVMWALLAFLLNFVPNIGSIIAAVPAILVALLQLGLAAAAWSAGGFLLVNFMVGSVLEPWVMGRGVGLSSLVVFLSLVFWGWVLGLVGMLLSVPLTIAVRIALDADQDTRWLAVLLGPRSGPDQPGTEPD